MLTEKDSSFPSMTMAIGILVGMCSFYDGAPIWLGVVGSIAFGIGYLLYEKQKEA